MKRRMAVIIMRKKHPDGDHEIMKTSDHEKALGHTFHKIETSSSCDELTHGKCDCQVWFIPVEGRTGVGPETGVKGGKG